MDDLPAPSSFTFEDVTTLQTNAIFANFRETAPELPLQLLHPSFGLFLEVSRSRGGEGLGTAEYDCVGGLCKTMCAYYPSEKERQDKFFAKLDNYLNSPFKTSFPLSDKKNGMKADGVVTMTSLNVEEGEIPLVFCEIKNQGSNARTAESALQGQIYYSKYWVWRREKLPFLYEHSVCPGLLIELVGPCLRVGALAIGRGMAYQPLTSFLHLYIMKTADRAHMECLAWTLLALKKTVESLHDYYQTLMACKRLPEPSLPYPLHMDAKILVAPLKAGTFNGPKLLWTVGEGKDRQLVKYSDHYSAAVHSAWAAKGLAPRLLSCQRLAGGMMEVRMELLSEEEGWCSLHCLRSEEGKGFELAHAAALRALERAHRVHIAVPGR